MTKCRRESLGNLVDLVCESFSWQADVVSVLEYNVLHNIL